MQDGGQNECVRLKRLGKVGFDSDQDCMMQWKERVGTRLGRVDLLLNGIPEFNIFAYKERGSRSILLEKLGQVFKLLPGRRGLDNNKNLIDLQPWTWSNTRTWRISMISRTWRHSSGDIITLLNIPRGRFKSGARTVSPARWPDRRGTSIWSSLRIWSMTFGCEWRVSGCK